MWPNLQFPFTEEIFNAKLYFLCSVLLVATRCHLLSLDLLLFRLITNDQFLMFYFQKNL